MADVFGPDDKAEEARLLARTEELARRTEALYRTPYDAAAHAALRRDLEAHRQDVTNYRARLLRRDPPDPTST